MSNRHKLKDRKFHLDVRHHLLTVRLLKQQHGMPREVAESPFLEIIKTCLNTALRNLL